MQAHVHVVVVGGDAAGLAAAVALARCGRSVLVIDAGAPRNALASGVHNFLTRECTPPADLYALGQGEILEYAGGVIPGLVAGLRRDEASEGVEVSLADGRAVWVRRLLVATGAADLLPVSPGLAERRGHDVWHCPFCHAWKARDGAPGAPGFGPVAMHATRSGGKSARTCPTPAHRACADAGAGPTACGVGRARCGGRGRRTGHREWSRVRPLPAHR